MKFHSLATASDGRRFVKQVEIPAWELRVSVKVLIGVSLIAFTYYIPETYAPLRVVLIVTGLTVLVATCVSTYLLLTRDILAHRERTQVIPQLPIGTGDDVAPQVITVNHGGKTTMMVIDAKDDELIKLILKLLDSSIMLTSPDSVLFPPYRRLNMVYRDYDSALMGLGSLVKRERGASPTLVSPHTLQSVRTMLASGTSLPYRQGATPSENRLKGA